MDERNVGREVVDARGGVTLRKELVRPDGGLPAVSYGFHSGREATVTVRVVEHAPEAPAPEALCFRGEDASRAWQLKGPKLEFEATVPAGGTRTTTCAVRGAEAAAIEELLDGPEIFEVTPPMTPSGESLVDELVAELRAGAAAAESRRFLEAEFGGGAETRGSVDARLARLQSDVTDVLAYAEALETFLDESGSGREALDRLQEDVSSMEGRLDDLEASANGHEGDIDEIQADVEDLTAAVESLSESFDGLAAHISTFEKTLDRHEERLPESDVEARIDGVERELAELDGFTEDLKTAFQQ